MNIHHLCHPCQQKFDREVDDHDREVDDHGVDELFTAQIVDGVVDLLLADDEVVSLADEVDDEVAEEVGKKSVLLNNIFENFQKMSILNSM